MTEPLWKPPKPRFFVGLTALVVVAACIFWMPILEGKPSLIHGKHGGGVFLFLILPLLFVSIWGVRTGWRQAAGTKEDIAASKAKGLASRLKLGCAAFLIGPIGSGAVGYYLANTTQVHPLDRESMVTAYAVIGFLAGCVVAVFVLLSSIGE